MDNQHWWRASPFYTLDFYIIYTNVYTYRHWEKETHTHQQSNMYRPDLRVHSAVSYILYVYRQCTQLPRRVCSSPEYKCRHTYVYRQRVWVHLCSNTAHRNTADLLFALPFSLLSYYYFHSIYYLKKPYPYFIICLLIVKYKWLYWIRIRAEIYPATDDSSINNFNILRFLCIWYIWYPFNEAVVTAHVPQDPAAYL